MAYAYERQNADNGAYYNQVFTDARNGKIRTAKQFSKRILDGEAEVLQTEAHVAMELGLERKARTRRYCHCEAHP